MHETAFLGGQTNIPHFLMQVGDGEEVSLQNVLALDHLPLIAPLVRATVVSRRGATVPFDSRMS